MEKRNLYYLDCHVAGRMYHDADEIWDKLKIGTKLHLVREADNRYDPEAVAIVYRDDDMERPECQEKPLMYQEQPEYNDDSEEYLIGYVPRCHNTELAAFFDMGWGDIFECRICRIDPEAHPEQQLRVTIKIKRNPRAERGSSPAIKC